MDELTRLFRRTIAARSHAVSFSRHSASPPWRMPLARAFGQGQCAGRDRDTTAACNKTPFKAPFEPTGWKTVLLDHFNMQVTDAEREAAFYAAFMGWKVRSNDGNEIYMDIGDWGGVKIRGGYTPPRGRRSRRWRRAVVVAAERAGAGAWRRTDAAVAAAARRWPRRWRRRRRRRATTRATWPRAPRRERKEFRTAARCGTASAGASTPWDTNKVEAALKARGLNPVADHSGDDFRSFHVKDPDGMDVQITNGNKQQSPPNAGERKAQRRRCRSSRRAGRRCISTTSRIRCTSYKETVAFYEALLGWKGLGDEGSQNETQISPEIGGLLIRGGNATSPTFVMPPVRERVDEPHLVRHHAVRSGQGRAAELCKRGLQARVDTGAIASSPRSEKDIHTATL